MFLLDCAYDNLGVPGKSCPVTKNCHRAVQIALNEKRSSFGWRLTSRFIARKTGKQNCLVIPQFRLQVGSRNSHDHASSLSAVQLHGATAKPSLQNQHKASMAGAAKQCRPSAVLTISVTSCLAVFAVTLSGESLSPSNYG